MYGIYTMRIYMIMVAKELEKARYNLENDIEVQTTLIRQDDKHYYLGKYVVLFGIAGNYYLIAYILSSVHKYVTKDKQEMVDHIFGLIYD